VQLRNYKSSGLLLPGQCGYGSPRGLGEVQASVIAKLLFNQYTMRFIRNRLRGYQINGYPVEAESEEEAVENQRRRIEAAIKRKLQNQWINRTNWLCVVIDDITHWNDRIQEAMNPVFA
jgi:hypothetical protein